VIKSEEELSDVQSVQKLTFGLVQVLMFVAGDASSPVVTFTFLHGAEANLTAFVHHLEAYLPLFRSFHLPISLSGEGRLRTSKTPHNFSILW